jgi:hypothetical protein
VGIASNFLNYRSALGRIPEASVLHLAALRPLREKGLVTDPHQYVHADCAPDGSAVHHRFGASHAAPGE